MRLDHSLRLKGMLKTLLALTGLLALAGESWADPRMVRVIWDVGNQRVYYKTYVRTEVGYDSFAVPESAAQAITSGGFVAGKAAFLRKGDRVRVYVVNYNPVSHVWHDSSTIEQVAPDASLVGPILNAALLAITGAGKSPGPGISPFSLTIGGSEVAPACAELEPIRVALSGFRTEASELYALSVQALAEAESDRAGSENCTRLHASRREATAHAGTPETSLRVRLTVTATSLPRETLRDLQAVAAKRLARVLRMRRCASRA